MATISKIGSYLSGVSCLILLFYGAAQALDTGDLSPDFAIVLIDGKEMSYFSDIKGKMPVYLIFWATW